MGYAVVSAGEHFDKSREAGRQQLATPTAPSRLPACTNGREVFVVVASPMTETVFHKKGLTGG